MAKDRRKLYCADDIYRHLKIPRRYLKRLLTQLSKSDLMESIKGNKGGFRLTRDASEITLLDIVHATDSNKENNKCFFGFKECMFGGKCYMHDKWTTIIEGIDRLLKTTTLSELTDKVTQRYIFDNM
jgi:Rrf2 family protein